jgi:hypothetical protein
MKVIAIERGFFDGAPRERGDVFEVPDGRKARWYAPAEDAASKAKPRAKAKGGEPATFSEMAHADSAVLTPKGADDLV